MRHPLLDTSVNALSAETHRHAYNAAFVELGLSWYWDSATYARLQVHEGDCVTTYLHTEQPHLLRAYDAGFLVLAIETAKARGYRGTTVGKAHPALHAAPSSAPLSHQTA